MRFQKSYARFVFSIMTMTFKALYKCYARRVFLGAGK